MIALKIDVDTLRGTQHGVPTLISVLRRHGAQATFLFSVGPDHTGRALRRALRPGFAAKVARTSVVSHYGIRTLLYGTLLPGPDIGRRAGHVMRQAHDAGFETGLHCYDHVKWQDGVRGADARWTQSQLQLAVERYIAIFGEAPRVHGAAGWQMTQHALRSIDALGFEYCSDGRGRSPHVAQWNGTRYRCPQIPTTLPTLDEMIGIGGCNEANVDQQVLAKTSDPGTVHVYTAHAELEGMRLAPVFERLLRGWRAQGHEVVALRTLVERADSRRWPRCNVGWGTVDGRSGQVFVQQESIPD